MGLALGLRERGHDVLLATSEFYRRKIEGAGLQFSPLRPLTAPDDPEMLERVLHSRKGPEYLIRTLLEIGYVGTLGTKLPRFRQINQAFITQAQVDQLTPDVRTRMEIMGIPDFVIDGERILSVQARSMVPASVPADPAPEELRVVATTDGYGLAPGDLTLDQEFLYMGAESWVAAVDSQGVAEIDGLPPSVPLALAVLRGGVSLPVAPDPIQLGWR